ncbi:MazG-like family protein [Streptomyces sp. NPDC020412]|uniref:MazG-like family protein n=1 Tax=Streptomyces sp. NPDC020412 TaxID=3365073 RepID=UPI0037AFB185
MNYETWALVRGLVEGLDRINGTSEAETSMRLLKLVEEVGEVGAAYIGATAQNPRKGVTHTKEDVASELCDVMLTAAVALHRFTDKPEYVFGEHVRNVARRARNSYDVTEDENFEIPPDLDRMLPHEITEWLATVEEDESSTEAQVMKARKAVRSALGVDD